MMDKDNPFIVDSQKTKVLKVLAHPVRLSIVKNLLKNGASNVSHIKRCLELPQSTLSQHLQKLKSMGIVECERKGLEVNYFVQSDRIKRLLDLLVNDER